MASKVKGDGRTTRWDAHRDQRRAELVLAAVRAIDQHGPDVTIADIASEAGVSKPVLYRYFTDKDELHAAVGRWGAQEVLDGMLPALRADAPVRDRVAQAVDAYLTTLEQHPQVFLLLVRHRGPDPLADGKAAIAAAFSRVLGDMLRGLNVDAAGAEPWAEGLLGLGLSTGEWWLERRTMTKAAVGGYLTTFIWHALEGAATELGVPLSALDQPAATRAPEPTPIRGRRRS
jgi:AcrR family transcriptional regulator